MERSYGSTWRDRDKKALNAGKEAFKRKAKGAVTDVDNLMRVKIPQKKNQLVSLLQKQGGQAGVKSKQVARGVKAGVSQGKRSLMEILRKIFKGI